MTLPAQGLRGLTRRLPPGPADLRRTATARPPTGPGLRRAPPPGHAGRAARPQPAGSLARDGDLPDHRLNWDQAKALAGQDRQPPRFRPRLKRRDPLSTTARVTLLAAVTAFGVLPYAEELLRCWRASPRLSPLPEPAEPATETLRAPGGDQVSEPRQGSQPKTRASGS
jgi:hypothetical protein